MSGDAVAVPDLEPGTAVGEYVIKCKIGQGGMGEVYAGEQPMIGKQVAIKVLASQLVQDKGLVQRLLDEARAVNLIRHPNIIDIFSFGTLPDHRPYFVMEYLEGESLESALARDAVAPADLTRLVEQLCDALGSAHQAGFVHRDLKPENLWLQRKPDGSVFLKILDFGIAKNMRVPSPGLTTNGQVLGTAQYMAPEQALARAIDGRTDIYAVGIVLYRILAGVLPFDGPNTYAVVTKHITEAPQPISSHRQVPADIEDVVMRCLAKDPAQRPQTVFQLWGELRPGLESWQAARLAAGWAQTVYVSAPVPIVVRPTVAASPDTAKGQSQTTIQPVEQARVQTVKASRAGRRLLTIGLVSTVGIAGGVGIFVSSLGSKPHLSQSPVVLLASSYDAGSVDVLRARQPAVIQGGRDGGAGEVPSSQPQSQSRPRHPAKKESRDHANPVRL